MEVGNFLQRCGITKRLSQLAFDSILGCEIQLFEHLHGDVEALRGVPSLEGNILVMRGDRIHIAGMSTV
jgi:hypothetical protein